MVGQDPLELDVSDDAAERAQEIIEQMGGDREAAHIKLDELLCDVLRDHGEEELVAVFEAYGKWYA